jgi:hypothetical protein
MTDSFSGEPQAPVPSGPKPKSPLMTFLTSSTGRLIVGGILLFIVLVVAGTFGFFFLVNQGNQAVTPVGPPAGGGTAAPTATVVPTNPREQRLEDTFTYRNIFAPTVKPRTTASTSNSDSDSGSTTTSDSANGPADTLILKAITVENGVRTARFEWNGTNYMSVKGDTVDDSPWQVLEIYSDSVLMLYGDSRVTLTVGQGFSSGGDINTK